MRRVALLPVALALFASGHNARATPVTVDVHEMDGSSSFYDSGVQATPFSFSYETYYFLQVTPTRISITATGGFGFAADSFNGFIFTFAGEPIITGVMPETGNAIGLTGSTFTPNSVALNFSGQPTTLGQSATFDIQTLATPEPSSLMLLGTASLAMAGALRRRLRR